MKKYKIGIIGLGIVGTAVKDLFKEAKIYDPNRKESLTKEQFNKDLDFAFICVPTNQLESGQCDTSIVEEAVKWAEPKYGFICLSTVSIGTTERLVQSYGKNIVFSPEYFGEGVAHPLTSLKDQPFAILGGTQEAIDKVISLYQTVYNSNLKIFQTDSRTAEFIKYMENSWIATKVTFFNEAFDLAELFGVNYNQFREGFLNDPRVTSSHTFVYESQRGWDGKCLHPDTKVYTDDGFRVAKELITGDKVLTFDGTYQQITEVFKRYVDEDLVNIKGQGHDEFMVTKEHPVLTVKADRKYYGVQRRKFGNFRKKQMVLEWVDADNLEKGDFIVLPKIKDANKNRINDVMRLYGYYLAEGNIEKSSSRITFGFHRKETNLVDDVERIVTKYYGARCVRIQKNNSLNLRVVCKELAEELKLNCGEKSYSKKISKEVLNSSTEGLGELIKGYFYGDGSKSTGIYSFITVSEKLFYQFKLILLKLGVGFTQSIRKENISRDGVHHRTSYNIRIRNYTDIKLFSLVVATTIEKELKLFRKTSWFDDNYLYIPIKEISKEKYKGEVINFEVANNHTYVIADAVVHNCIPKDTAGLCYSAVQAGRPAHLIEAVRKINNIHLKENK